jgi:ADP-heptose:LPS heptosyltransferase
MSGRRRDPVIVARLDSAGDVLLAGPAVRAVASDHPVVMVAGPLGAEAARLLPGVSDVIELAAPWVLTNPPPVDGSVLATFIAEVATLRARSAAILTSSHQSPLPLALALRLAGVPELAGISVDYPGSLLDHRIPGDPEVHEVTRALAIVRRLGHRLPDGDDRLAVALESPGSAGSAGDEPYVVVHPGASAEARTLSPERWQAVVSALGAAGRRVVVTGSAGETALTAAVAAAHPDAIDQGGAGTLAGLASTIAGADAIVCGNTGPMHLAAAVGTPVAAVFPPTVPLARWRPWRVPHVVLGDQDAPCLGCRSRTCAVPGQPCLDPATPEAVVDAVDLLAGPPPTLRPAETAATPATSATAPVPTPEEVG